jgi:hypothetical protein
MLLGLEPFLLSCWIAGVLFPLVPISLPSSNTSWCLVLFDIFWFPPPSVMQAQQGFGSMLVSLLFCDHSCMGFIGIQYFVKVLLTVPYFTRLWL